MKLTNHDIAALRQGARHPDGVINPPKKSNFDRPEKRMAILVAAGLATPSPHSDWYITPAGRQIVQSEDERNINFGSEGPSWASQHNAE